MFDILVCSILGYSAEVWGIYEAKDIEILHTKFCRWVLNVKKFTNLSGLYGELGRVPLLIHREISMVRYCIKPPISGDNFIPKKVYIMLKNDADYITYNGLNWAYQIKCILDSI